MKKILIAAVCASLALPAMATTNRVDAARQGTNLFPFAPKARAEQEHAQLGNPMVSNRKSAAGDGLKVGAFRSLAQTSLPSAAIIGYLDGPKNETWYYAGDYIYTDGQVTGFDFTIYNGLFEKVGAVRDNIELEEGETRVAEVSVGPAITQKFFNFDNNYEVMVDVATNTVNYVNNYKTQIYSITDLADGEESECKMTLPGYYVSAINTAQDDWSENFFITFMTEEDTETPMVGEVPNVADIRFVTYKKAGYSGNLTVMLDCRIPSITTAGVDAIPFLATQKDGVPYFVINNLKYCWYNNPYDYTTDTPTPDNELIVKIFAPSSSFASTADLYSTTRLPLGTTDDDLYFLYVGTFMYNDDIDMNRNPDGTPMLYVTRAHSQQGGDSYLYDFEAYDGAKKGEDAVATKKYDISTGTTGGYFMNDIAGFDPQVMFIFEDNGAYDFQFVNLLDGSVEHTIPYNFNDGSATYNMNALVNRISSGNSYLYAVPQTKGFSDDNGDCHTYVVFASPEGDIVSVDDINMGQNVEYGSIYTGVGAYNPYLFNLDSDNEYLMLLKRRTGSGNQEEFAVISANPEKGTLVNVAPDDEKGLPNTAALINTEKDNPKLVINYVNRIPGNWQYTTAYFDLPLTLFEAGEGTADSPYEISTVGGLMQIKSAPDACYAVVADIDADGVVVKSSDFNFTGALDGRGHVISNLTLEGRALLPVVTGELPQTDEDGNLSDTDQTKGVVRNLKFYNAKLDATVDGQGLVVGRLSSGRLNNIHVYNSVVNSIEDAGGIVGNVVSYSSVSECSFDGKIVSPENSVGGIALSTSTSSSVSTCAFTGTIEGGSEVGGILGSVGSYGNGAVNCHVNADITGKNTVGGIVGSAAAVTISNNHVQGTLTATENLRWGGGAKVGGIAGSYPLSFGSEGDEVAPTIHSNFINLTSITAPEPTEGEYPAQNATVHRVVGYTRANYAEEEDYDPDTYEPIYGEPLPAETAIQNNYVISTLPIVDSEIADDANTTEGKSIAAEDLGMDFFEEQLGFAYGFDSESPWAITSDATAPRLFFENVLLLIKPESASVEVGDEIAINVIIYGEEISEEMLGDFPCDYNESLIEMTDMFLTDEGILLTLTGLAEGECDLTIGMRGQTVKSHITVLAKSGVDNIVVNEAASLTFDGRNLNAAGAAIEVFNLSGVKVLAGHDSLNTESLAAGVYIAVAKDAAGNSTLKFCVK